MAFLVKISSRAGRDLAYPYQEIYPQHSDAAFKWYVGLKEAILRLEEQPRRCSMARKRDGLRHLLYGRKPHTYRVIFRVLEKEKYIEVLHIRYGARKKFKESDLA